MPTTTSPSGGCRARRRLLIAARARFAEDRLGDAVSAGIGQAVLLGTALDTFAVHNPYPHLRVFEVARCESGIDIALAAMDFDPAQRGFVIRLGTPQYGDMAVREALSELGGLATGSEVVFDYLPSPTSSLRELLRGNGFEILENLGSVELAARYLDRPIEPAHSPEPRVARARVRNCPGQSTATPGAPRTG